MSTLAEIVAAVQSGAISPDEAAFYLQDRSYYEPAEGESIARNYADALHILTSGTGLIIPADVWEIIERGDGARPGVVTSFQRSRIDNTPYVPGGEYLSSSPPPPGTDAEAIGGFLTPIQAQEALDPGGAFRRFALGSVPGIRNISAPFRNWAFGGDRATDAMARFYTTAAQQRIGKPEGTPSPTFESFLGGPRQTSTQLGEALSQIADLFGLEEPPLHGAGQALSVFEGQPIRQLRASLQPSLASLSPALRGGWRDYVRRIYDDYTAENPQQAWLPFAKRGGLFGSGTGFGGR